MSFAWLRVDLGQVADLLAGSEEALQVPCHRAQRAAGPAAAHPMREHSASQSFTPPGGRPCAPAAAPDARRLRGPAPTPAAAADARSNRPARRCADTSSRVGIRHSGILLTWNLRSHRARELGGRILRRRRSRAPWLPDRDCDRRQHHDSSRLRAHPSLRAPARGGAPTPPAHRRDQVERPAPRDGDVGGHRGRGRVRVFRRALGQGPGRRRLARHRRASVHAACRAGPDLANVVGPCAHSVRPGGCSPGVRAARR